MAIYYSFVLPVTFDIYLKERAKILSVSILAKVILLVVKILLSKNTIFLRNLVEMLREKKIKN